MTDQELRDIAKKYWEVNKKNAAPLAETLMAKHKDSIPAVVISLPGLPAFLTDTMRFCFQWGAIAVINQYGAQLLEVQKAAREAGLELEKKVMDALDPTGIVQ